MKKNMFRLVSFFSVFILAVVVLGSGANSAYANTCTAVSDGDWHTVSRWSGCGGVLPQAADDVVIPDNFAITMSGSSTVTSLTIENAATTVNGLTIGTGNTLTVSGAVSLAASTGAASTLAIGAGTLSVGTDLTIAGDGTNDSAVTLTAGGTLTVGDDIVFSGTAGHAKLTSTGATTINLGGDMLPAAGTVTRGSNTLNLNGGAAQSLGVSTGAYNNLTITNTSGGVTTTGQVTVNGDLVIAEGTFDPGAQQLDVTGTTTIETGGILLLSSVNANKTFTGDFTINSGGTLTESAATVPTFGGSLTNNGTLTALAGAHTFSGTGEVLAGTLTIPSVSVSGTYTNSGTLTAATLLTVAGTLTNTGTVTATTSLEGAGGFTNTTGTLNIGDANTITTLTATNNANTINYTKAGAQTVLDGASHEYGNLGLSGSGAKTITAATLIGGNLTIGGTATATMSGDLNTADKLYFGTSLQRNGTWGAVATTTPDAAHETNTQFTTGVDALITVANGSSGSGGSAVNQPVYTNTASSSSSSSITEEETPASVDDVVCATGQMYSASSGKKCTKFTSSDDVSCPPGIMYNSASGKKCTTWTGSQGNGYAFGTALVKMGTQGEACKAWQMFLNDKANAGLVTDGWCGKLTIAAAKAWQASKGLVADGLLGPASRAKAMMQ